ncbi:MAG: DUF4160 domain-containing protein [Prevotellaceae bacterium]|jgi:hypothetical protein|nr:DUF4160 domain-containing protein [Prevotellaceae bacterium]
MPTILEYFGLMFRIYTAEHQPPHVHVVDGKNEMIIRYFPKDGKVARVTYEVTKGKFSPAKLSEVKTIAKAFQGYFLKVWFDIFVMQKTSISKLVVEIKAKNIKELQKKYLNNHENL